MTDTNELALLVIKSEVLDVDDIHELKETDEDLPEPILNRNESAPQTSQRTKRTRLKRDQSEISPNTKSSKYEKCCGMTFLSRENLGIHLATSEYHLKLFEQSQKSPNSVRILTQPKIQSTETKYDQVDDEPTENSDTELTFVECCFRNCGKTFSQLQKCRDHIMKLHQVPIENVNFYKSYKCIYCKESFQTKLRLQRHFLTNKHKVKFKSNKGLTKASARTQSNPVSLENLSCDLTLICRQCENSFEHRKTCIKHIKQIHGIEKFEPLIACYCFNCDVTFDATKEEMLKHAKEANGIIDNDDRRIITYQKKSNINSKKSGTSKNKSVVQKSLPEIKATEKTLTTKKISKVGCRMCDMKFATFIALKMHVGQVHPEVNSRIEEHKLNKKMEKEQLKKIGYIEQPKFPCEYCPSVFYTKHSRKIHEKSVHEKVS